MPAAPPSPSGAEIPFSSEPVAYAWAELIRRMGLPRDADQPRLRYGPVVTDGTGPDVIVEPCGADRWASAWRRSSPSLTWAPIEELLPPGAAITVSSPVPLLFHRTDRSGPWIGLDENSGALRLDVDFVASTFFMLSRWEEITDPARDDHGRFPAQKSWAFRAGFLDRPVIDEYALILRAWLEVAQPRLPATTNRFQVEISHDVDHIGRFPTKASLLRQLRSGLAQRGTSTLRTWRDFRVERKEPGVSAEIERTRWLATVSSQNGLASIFNFMAARPSHYDPGYDVEAPHVRSLMQELSNLGCEIGFHPSYKTFSDPRLMAEEKATLDRAAPQPARGGRQHFLRFEAPTTWRAWSDLGLNYDSTVGYADHEGFRCGTCHPFNAFDTEQNEVLPIEERPLLVMDGTLLDYRGLSVDEGYARVLALASKARDVGGIFTLLWHNTSLDGRWSEWGRRYPALVEALAAL